MRISSLKAYILILFVWNVHLLVAQETICIPYGVSPVMDGIISSDEWIDTDSVMITVTGNKIVRVKFKHDSVNLYVAYLDHLESAFRFPEIVLDIHNDKSTSWMEDDWWFHVSATDCVSNGVPNDYNDCLVTQPDWEAMPNMVPGPPSTDAVEMRIPLLKVGIDLEVNATIGLAFNVTNTSSIWNYWPSTANSLNPSTWANAVFCSGTVGINELAGKTYLDIFPNPFSSRTILRSGHPLNDASLIVYNSFGQPVKHFNNISGDSFEFNRVNLTAGMYFFHLVQDNSIIASDKFVITD